MSKRWWSFIRGKVAGFHSRPETFPAHPCHSSQSSGPLQTVMGFGNSTCCFSTAEVRMARSYASGTGCPGTLRNWDRANKLKPSRHPLNRYRLYGRKELEKLLEIIHVLKGGSGSDKEFANE